MKSGAKAKPGRIRRWAVHTYFGIPGLGQGFAVGSFCFAFPGAVNSRVFRLYLRGDQREGIAGDEWIVGKGKQKAPTANHCPTPGIPKSVLSAQRRMRP